MIIRFLRERLSWITFFVFLQFFLFFMSYLDSSISVHSVLYVNLLSFLLFGLFLLLRYKRETPFYKSLTEREDNLDTTNIEEPRSPFEKIIERSIINQTDALNQSMRASQLALEQEKDDLLSWIHEVKTPLTAMHLMIDRLEDGALKSNMTYEWLRIYFLLDQQLHQKRIPFMENDLYIERTDLEAVIFDEIRTLQSWCLQKGIGFELELEMTEVLSDAKWLGFIIRQLLTNAVKYSEDSDILIRSYHKDGKTHLEVKDFGRGINPKDLPRIFDRGFTSTSDHQDTAATGMGLYLAQNAARSLLIRIEAKSRQGEGSVFTLSFPEQNEFVNITGM